MNDREYLLALAVVCLLALQLCGCTTAPVESSSLVCLQETPPLEGCSVSWGQRYNNPPACYLHHHILREFLERAQALECCIQDLPERAQDGPETCPDPSGWWEAAERFQEAQDCDMLEFLAWTAEVCG